MRTTAPRRKRYWKSQEHATGRQATDVEAVPAEVRTASEPKGDKAEAQDSAAIGATVAAVAPQTQEHTRIGKIQTGMVSVALLRPYAKNAEIYQDRNDAVLQESIRVNGVRNDLLADEDGSVRQFVKDRVVACEGADVTVAELQQAYFKYCDEMGWLAFSGREFQCSIADLMLELRHVSRRNDNTRTGEKAARGFKHITTMGGEQ